MRMMMKVCIPVEAGNRGVKDGTLPRTFGTFIEQHKPEATYFVAEGGKRTALFFFDLKDPASIPSVAEPFFMNFNAAVECTPAMNAEDMKAGVARAATQS
jgi:hypothetical protein